MGVLVDVLYLINIPRLLTPRRRAPISNYLFICVTFVTTLFLTLIYFSEMFWENIVFIMIFVLLFLIVFYNISKNKTDLEDEAIDYALVTTERNRAQNETKISDLERDVDNTTDVLKKRNLQREIANLKQENAVTDLDEKRIFDNELIEEVRKNLTEGDKEDLKTLKEKSDDIERRMQVLLQDENIDKDVGITNEISALMAKQKNLQDIKNRKFGYANEKKRKIKQSVDELDTELTDLDNLEKVYKKDEKKLINSIKYESTPANKIKMERDLKNLGRAVEKVKEDRELLKRKKKVLNQGRVDNLKTLDLYNEGATAIRAEAVANDSLIRNLEKSRLKRAKTKADREVLERASRRIEEREAQQELVDQALALELKDPGITGETPGDKETVWKSLKEQNYARREYSILKRKRNVLERDVDAKRTDVRLATEKYQEELKNKIGPDKLEALKSIGFNFGGGGAAADAAAVTTALNIVDAAIAGKYANDAVRQTAVDAAIDAFFTTAGDTTATLATAAATATKEELAEKFYKENFGSVDVKNRDDAFVAAYNRRARASPAAAAKKQLIDDINDDDIKAATGEENITDKKSKALKAKIAQFKLDMDTEGLKKEAETTADLVGKREKLKDELKKDYQIGPLKAYGDLVAEGQEYVDTENAILALEAKLKQTTFIKKSRGVGNPVIAVGGRVTDTDLGIPTDKITANEYFHDMTVDNLGKTAETKKAIDELGEDISEKSGELMSELVGKYKLDKDSQPKDYFARRALGRSLYRNQTTTGLPSKLDTNGVLAARGGADAAPNPPPDTKRALLDKVVSILGVGDGGGQAAAQAQVDATQAAADAKDAADDAQAQAQAKDAAAQAQADAATDDDAKDAAARAKAAARAQVVAAAKAQVDAAKAQVDAAQAKAQAAATAKAQADDAADAAARADAAADTQVAEADDAKDQADTDATDTAATAQTATQVATDAADAAQTAKDAADAAAARAQTATRDAATAKDAADDAAKAQTQAATRAATAKDAADAAARAAATAQVAADDAATDDATQAAARAKAQTATDTAAAAQTATQTATDTADAAQTATQVATQAAAAAQTATQVATQAQADADTQVDVASQAKDQADAATKAAEVATKTAEVATKAQTEAAKAKAQAVKAADDAAKAQVDATKAQAAAAKVIADAATDAATAKGVIAQAQVDAAEAAQAARAAA